MEDCIFCRIIKGEIPSNKVYEDDKMIAIHDVAPAAPVHVLLIPKEHTENVTTAAPEHRNGPKAIASRLFLIPVASSNMHKKKS